MDTGTREMTGRKGVTYKDRVLAGLQDLTAGSPHKTFHYNSIRTQVKKNAEDAGETLGKLSKTYIKKATEACVEEGVLVPLKDSNMKYHYAPRAGNKRRISEAFVRNTPTKKRKSLGGSARTPAVFTSAKGGRRASMPASKAGPKAAGRGRKSEPLINRIGGRASATPTTIVDDDEESIEMEQEGTEATGKDGIEQVVESAAAGNVDIDELRAQLDKKDKEVEALRVELTKRAAVEMRYTPHSEGEQDMSNEYNMGDDMTFDTTYIDPVEPAQNVSTPSMSKTAPPLVTSSSGLDRQLSNVSSLSHHPTPSPSQSPSEQTTDKLRAELILVRAELDRASETATQLALQLEQACVAEAAHSVDLQGVRAELQGVNAALQETRLQFSTSRAQADTAQAELAAANQSMHILRETLEAHQSRISDLTEDQQHTQASLDTALQSIAVLEEQKAQFQLSLEEEGLRCVELQIEVELGKERLNAHAAQIAAGSAMLANVRYELVVANGELAVKDQEISTLRQALAVAHTQIEALRGDLEVVQAETMDLSAQLETEKQQHLDEAEEALVNLNEAQQHLQEEREAVAAQALEISQLRTTVSEREAEISALSAGVHDAQHEVVTVRDLLDASNSRIEELQTILAQELEEGIHRAMQTRKKLEWLETSLKTANDTKAALELSMEHVNGQLKAAMSELNVAKNEISRQDEVEQDLLSQKTELNNRLNVAEVELGSRIEELDAAKTELRAKIVALAAAREKVVGLEAQVECLRDTLKEADSRYESLHHRLMEAVSEGGKGEQEYKRKVRMSLTPA